MIYKIQIINYSSKKKLSFIKKNWNIIHDDNARFALIIKDNRIELKNRSLPFQKNISIDFNYQQMKLYQNDKKIKIIKAIGIKKNIFPNIIDATAGFGKDAFILFSHGYYVTMIERNPIISILLYDGLRRSYQDIKMKPLIHNRMKLIYNSSMNINHLNIKPPDVIYLDPMFPNYKKKALSKKNIITIQELVGCDPDSDTLLLKCISFATKKVVVKRPKKAKYLANLKPNYTINTKKHRFDIYLRRENKISLKHNI